MLHILKFSRIGKAFLVILILILLTALLFKCTQPAYAKEDFSNIAEDFSDIVEQIKKHSESDQSYIQEIVSSVNSTHTALESSSLNTTSEESLNKRDIIEEAITGYKKIKQSQCGLDKKDGFYIFISLSMPETLLKKYDLIAKQIGAKLVLRGFKNNSFKETVNYIQTLSSEGIIGEINPILYRKYSVNLVPSFVLAQGDKFDKLVGNVSVNYALTKFKDKGDLKIKASEYLARFKSNEGK